jgi:hypothetical protein
MYYFPPSDRSRMFIIYFITVGSWYKFHCCSPSSSRSWQVLLFFVVFRLICRVHLLLLPCMLHAPSFYCSWSSNQKHCFDTQCTAVYFNQFSLFLPHLLAWLSSDRKRRNCNRLQRLTFQFPTTRDNKVADSQIDTSLQPRVWGSCSGVW